MFRYNKYGRSRSTSYEGRRWTRFSTVLECVVNIIVVTCTIGTAFMEQNFRIGDVNHGELNDLNHAMFCNGYLYKIHDIHYVKDVHLHNIVVKHQFVYGQKHILFEMIFYVCNHAFVARISEDDHEYELMVEIDGIKNVY